MELGAFPTKSINSGNSRASFTPLSLRSALAKNDYFGYLGLALICCSDPCPVAAGWLWFHPPNRVLLSCLSAVSLSFSICHFLHTRHGTPPLPELSVLPTVLPTTYPGPDLTLFIQCCELLSLNLTLLSLVSYMHPFPIFHFCLASFPKQIPSWS